MLPMSALLPRMRVSESSATWRTSKPAALGTGMGARAGWVAGPSRVACSVRPLCFALAVLVAAAQVGAAESLWQQLRSNYACVRAMTLLQEEGEYEKGIAELARSLECWPKNPLAHYLLGWTYATSPDGRYRDGQKAVFHASQFADLCAEGGPDPDLEWLALACLAAAYAEAGEFNKAVQTQERSLAAAAKVPRPEAPERLKGLLELYRDGISLRTRYLTPVQVRVGHGDRALKFAQEGRYKEAIQAIEAQLKEDPQDYAAHSLASWIYATCPEAKYRDGQKAVHHATESLRLFAVLGQKNVAWIAYAEAAAAHAEAGDFQKAVELQNKALEYVANAPRSIRAHCEVRVRACLKLYEAGRPLWTKAASPAWLTDEWVKEVLEP